MFCAKGLKTLLKGIVFECRLGFDLFKWELNDFFVLQNVHFAHAVSEKCVYLKIMQIVEHLLLKGKCRLMKDFITT